MAVKSTRTGGRCDGRQGESALLAQAPRICRHPNFTTSMHHFEIPIPNMQSPTMDSSKKIFLNIDYKDTYVQPLLLSALNARLPSELMVLINEVSTGSPPLSARLLQWRQYEKIDFEHLLEHPETSLANSYVIRKALIRKHYLSATVLHWLTKHPESALAKHVKPTLDFEVDYAEFLDDALLEAFELKESWARNEGKDTATKEWWILKPGMSDRGQGVRLFSSEEELTAIFEEWDPPSDDESDDEDAAVHSDEEGEDATESEDDSGPANGVMASQLRHFVVQPYIHPPVLLPEPHPSAGRKFHIRTYVLAVGALKVYVYRPMLALFATQPYTPPATAEDGTSPNDVLTSHLTNTCLQSGEREGSVHTFWSLPSDLHLLAVSTAQPAGKASGEQNDWRHSVFAQICTVTSQTFEAAARSMSIHFQPLPNAFEIFGLDFMVDAQGTAWLLEVNAFPDFAQTGTELQSLVKGLFEGVVEVGVKPFFGLPVDGKYEHEMVEVLDVDLGRR